MLDDVIQRSEAEIERQYRDMRGCCETSLFEKGKCIPDSALHDMDLDDFEYSGHFPVAWKYCAGFEGPMAVYNYDELWVRRRTQYERIPNPDKHHFLDLVTHYPYCAKHDVFIAMSKKKVGGEWVGMLNIYRYARRWARVAQFSGRTGPKQ